MKMKTIIICISAVLFLSEPYAFSAKIKNFILDSSRIYEIKVAQKNTGTTTLMFPAELGAIQGANIAVEAGTNAGFVITYNKGSYFFSLQSEKEKADGSLNIVYNHKIYVLKLTAVSTDEAYSSVTFNNINQLANSNRNLSSNEQPTAAAPSVIRDLIEKARLYPVLKKQYPEYYENVELSNPEQLYKYSSYDVLLENVYRFKADDTVVFQLILKNRTSKTLVYDPHLLAARLGTKLYYSSVTVASGEIPSHGESPVWFAVSGTSSGGRNEMAADNNWTILLTAGKIDQKKTTLDINRTVIAKENELILQINNINKRLNSESLSENEIALLSKKIISVNAELQKIESQKSLINN